MPDLRWVPCEYNSDSTNLINAGGKLLGWVFFSRGEWTAVRQRGQASHYTDAATESAARAWVEEQVEIRGGNPDDR